MVTNVFSLFEPCIGTQPKHVVVSKASTSERLSKDYFLLWRRIEPKTVSSLNIHSLHQYSKYCKISKSIHPTAKAVGFLLGIL